MKTIELITEWVGTNENHPRFADDHGNFNWWDVTGQQGLKPDPNVVVIQCARDDVAFAAIQADENCFVLWSEDIVEEVI